MQLESDKNLNNFYVCSVSSQTICVSWIDDPLKFYWHISQSFKHMFQTAPSHKEKPMHNFTILLTAREKLGPKSQTSLHSALPDQSEFISKAVQVSKLH